MEKQNKNENVNCIVAIHGENWADSKYCIVRQTSHFFFFLFSKALPVASYRTQSYRDKKDHSSSRRGGFDRPSYDRKSDRPAYEGPSMFGGMFGGC